MNSKKKIYQAVIIGAGRIASSFDSPRSKNILTHAHAIRENSRMELAGIMDIDTVQGKKEAKKWNTEFFGDYHVMLDLLKPDIVVIATPDHTHKEILLDVLVHHPKVIILEKPVVNKKSEIESVRRAAHNAGVPVVVNFRRRFDPVVNEIRDSIIKGRYGSILSASAIYTKGILHNGSHMIDLARYLFGEMTSAKMHFSVNDFSEGESSVGGVATFERCPQFYLMTGDERSFYIFELCIVTEKNRIRFIDEGRRVVVEEVVRDTVYKDDRVLGPAKTKKTKLSESMMRMMDHAVRVVDGTEASHASLGDALRTQETCNKLLSTFKK